MPIRDPERKKEVVAAWRARSHTPAYMKWLYGRRKINSNLVDMYEVALTIIASGEADPYKIAVQAMENAKEMREELGNRFDHERDEPYWKE